MFFHVDESGNSGANLFDKDQPILSYGVLSAHTNVDVLAAHDHARMLKQLGTNALHANKLRFDGLIPIARDLLALQQKFNLRFDYYFINKFDFAVVAFHSAVFDAGLNEAVPWAWYWTPLRFPLVATLAQILDEDLIRESWALCQLPRKQILSATDQISTLLSKVRSKVHDRRDLDPRLREILTDGLRYAMRFPEKMDFGTYDKKVLTPNVVGFQFVLSSIARRLKANKAKVLRITVDQQSEFNAAQLRTFEFHSGLAKALNALPQEKDLYVSHPLMDGAREDVKAMLSHFPSRAFELSKSEESIGLQLTDTFLWLLNRYIRDDALPRELAPVVGRILRTGSIDGISAHAMMGRFQATMNKLPEEISLETRAKVQRSHRPPT